MYSRPVSDLTPERDEWMRRMGPFYPGLVALCALTVVPLPRGLTPTREDMLRGAKWFPAVGAASGIALAILCELLLWFGLSPAVVALLLVPASLAMTGTGLLLATASTVDDLVSRDRARGLDALGTHGTLALIGLLAVRVVALMSASPDEWGMALFFSEVISYWSVLFLLYIGDLLDEPDIRDRVFLAVGPISLPALGVGSGVAGGAVIVALWLSGAVVLLATLLAAAIAFALGVLFQRKMGGVSNRSLATIACLCGLLVLLAFSAAHPATVSPWIG